MSNFAQIKRIRSLKSMFIIKEFDFEDKNNPVIKVKVQKKQSVDTSDFTVYVLVKEKVNLASSIPTFLKHDILQFEISLFGLQIDSGYYFSSDQELQDWLKSNSSVEVDFTSADGARWKCDELGNSSRKEL